MGASGHLPIITSWEGKVKAHAVKYVVLAFHSETLEAPLDLRLRANGLTIIGESVVGLACIATGRTYQTPLQVV